MRTLSELIERHSSHESELRYYIPIIKQAETNEIDHPDITIECCTSLFQGISKTIVFRLAPQVDRNEFENLSIQRQVKTALRNLSANDDVIETAVPVAVENLVRVLAELRNTRGDISHGRAVPKELQSDRSLARLILNISEPVLRYMLATFFALKESDSQIIAYNDNELFNEYLDENNPMNGKPLYSLALHQQYYEDYIIQLDDFNYSDDEEV